MIDIQVRYTAQLKKMLGFGRQKIVLETGSTLQNLLEKLCLENGEDFEAMLFEEDTYREHILIVHNNSQVSYTQNPVLKFGDTVTLMSPISGG